MLDARFGERAFEGLVLVGRDVLVGPRLKRQERRLDGRSELRGARLAVGRLARAAVEPDRAGEAVTGRRGEPRVSAAHAEADGEDSLDAERAQVLDRRTHVLLDLLGRNGLDVRLPVEVVAPFLRAGGAAEVVERDRRVAALGEAQGQLLVEAVQP